MQLDSYGDDAEELLLDNRKKTKCNPLLILPIVGLLFIIIGVVAAVGWEDDSTTTDSHAEVIFDNWGVPHIYANNVTNYAYGMGYAQAANSADALLELIGTARCRAAEYWGSSFLASDQTLLTIGLREIGEYHYQTDSALSIEVYDAFAAGINRYLSHNQDKVDPAKFVVYPVTGLDVCTYCQYVAFFFAAYEAFGRIAQWNAVSNVAASPSVNGTSMGLPWMSEYVKSGELPTGFVFEAMNAKDTGFGSNAFAARRPGGGSVLHINPHLSYTALSNRFFEAHAVVSEDNIAFYGAALLGMPLFAMGFGKQSGWAHTVNTVSAYTLYELQLNVATLSYRLDGAWVPLERKDYTIKVKGSNDVSYSAMYSQFGPILALNSAYTKIVAIRLPTYGNNRHIDQYYGQMKSSNLGEFVHSAALVQSPIFTFVYGDSDGHIYYLSNSMTPNYGSGTWAQWTGLPFPTDNSTFLWDYDELVPFPSLPTVTDPPSGWIQNANDNPWQATLPLSSPNPSLSPQWISPPYDPATYNTGPYNFRARAQQRQILRAYNNGLTYSDAVTISMSVELESAYHLLQPLIQAITNTGTQDPLLLEAQQILSNWDGQATADSPVLFSEWVRAHYFPLSSSQQLFEVLFNESDPINTPSGIANETLAVQTLSQAIQSLIDTGLPINTTIGTVRKFPRDRYNIAYPAHGDCDPLGSVRTACTPNREPGVSTVTVGSGGTFKAVVEFTPNGLGAVGVVLSYGNAMQAGHPHNGDQWELWSKREYRKPYLQRGDVETNMEYKVDI